MTTKTIDDLQIQETNLFDSSIAGSVREAVDFIANILESSTEYSIIGMDLADKILLWNEGARRLYGYEPEEVVGKAHSALLRVPADVKAGHHAAQLAATLTKANGKAPLSASARTGASSRRGWLSPLGVIVKGNRLGSCSFLKCPSPDFVDPELSPTFLN
jgi:PAS domain-containing protein